MLALGFWVTRRCFWLWLSVESMHKEIITVHKNCIFGETLDVTWAQDASRAYAEDVITDIWPDSDKVHFFVHRAREESHARSAARRRETWCNMWTRTCILRTNCFSDHANGLCAQCVCFAWPTLVSSETLGTRAFCLVRRLPAADS